MSGEKVRIKIVDLPKDQKVNREEMKKVRGGFNPQPEPPGRMYNYQPIYVPPFIPKIGY